MTEAKPRRVAIVLCNLGGPDEPAAVRPFLYNLFNDPFIIAAPFPIRPALAWLISTLRAPLARQTYAKIGGRSPLLEETRKQADALDEAIRTRIIGAEAKCFVAMRHWRPLTSAAARAAADWGATEAVLLPLYPQFSGATTGSARAAWAKASRLPTREICCWPAGEKFARAHADLIMKAWEKAGRPPAPRLLFSAHGLPERAIAAGDPYQSQVEMSAAKIRALLPADWPKDADVQISYQSRVGPLKWIGPSTEAEIDRARAEGRGLIVCPIAFVSEHVETLVELDIDYAERAKDLPFYIRVPALGPHPVFIDALADLVTAALAHQSPASETGARLCAAHFRLCPHASPA